MLSFRCHKCTLSLNDSFWRFWCWSTNESWHFSELLKCFKHVVSWSRFYFNPLDANLHFLSTAWNDGRLHWKVSVTSGGAHYLSRNLCPVCQFGDGVYSLRWGSSESECRKEKLLLTSRKLYIKSENWIWNEGGIVLLKGEKLIFWGMHWLRQTREADI